MRSSTSTVFYWQVSTSKAYFEAQGSQIAIPDFTGVAGWDGRFDIEGNTSGTLEWWLVAMDGAPLDVMSRTAPTQEAVVTETGWSAEAVIPR